MKYCDPRAYAVCPEKEACGSFADAHFAEGSECDKFNEEVLRGRGPLTNADRIRAMSDEELAQILIGVMDIDDKIHFCKNKPECEKLMDTDDGIPVEWCEACMLEWLQQPAKGDAECQ